MYCRTVLPANGCLCLWERLCIWRRLRVLVCWPACKFLMISIISLPLTQLSHANAFARIRASMQMFIFAPSYIFIKCWTTTVQLIIFAQIKRQLILFVWKHYLRHYNVTYIMLFVCRKCKYWLLALFLIFPYLLNPLVSNIYLLNILVLSMVNGLPVRCLSAA